MVHARRAEESDPRISGERVRANRLLTFVLDERKYTLLLKQKLVVDLLHLLDADGLVLCLLLQVAHIPGALFFDLDGISDRTTSVRIKYLFHPGKM